jgi:sugar/nucleoside kinase (ribokinase family)
MTSEAPRPALDLLVVGGVTIDRFADGSSAPGGTAVHVARSAAPRGMRLGVVTSAGPEPEAQRGLAELRGRAAFLESTTHAASPTFRHRETRSGRRLWLERMGGPVSLASTDGQTIATRAVLYAPIASEIEVEALDVWDGAMPRAGILQGWLRTTQEGIEVGPLPLSSLDPAVVDALARFDLLVASREDLVADAAKPDDQLTALRATFGPRPALIVTNATHGLWIDLEGSRRHVAAPWVVRDAPTVGAGDILAAFLIMPDADPLADWFARAEKAMRVVAEDLEDRKRR